jgi:hypothetical protein
MMLHQDTGVNRRCIEELMDVLIKSGNCQLCYYLLLNISRNYNHTIPPHVLQTVSFALWESDIKEHWFLAQKCFELLCDIHGETFVFTQMWKSNTDLSIFHIPLKCLILTDDVFGIVQYIKRCRMLLPHDDLGVKNMYHYALDNIPSHVCTEHNSSLSFLPSFTSALFTLFSISVN